ncbi:hypothetical protein BAY61_15620 [Prauserella marina]|uniref:Uncharacterized protein n=1 Tax=Prauserella marina TaxID=530584 RepID=A0A222VQL0_9PSEU|nr:hypothetical protein [Prauserella marina]ASR36198.1 hypothetical protein BAY61_15620 [Prauserella marina]PWV76952.1 hypothetical protein DES30_105169 [Prauserella marina]SDD01026.1 hypothetical protein SAMN05421630_105170 [Prauserella marina]
MSTEEKASALLNGTHVALGGRYDLARERAVDGEHERRRRLGVFTWLFWVILGFVGGYFAVYFLSLFGIADFGFDQAAELFNVITIAIAIIAFSLAFYSLYASTSEDDPGRTSAAAVPSPEAAVAAVREEELVRRLASIERKLDALGKAGVPSAREPR